MAESKKTPLAKAGEEATEPKVVAAPPSPKPRPMQSKQAFAQEIADAEAAKIAAKQAKIEAEAEEDRRVVRESVWALACPMKERHPGILFHSKPDISKFRIRPDQWYSSYREPGAYWNDKQVPFCQVCWEASGRTKQVGLHARPRFLIRIKADEADKLTEDKSDA